jgi:uncharacterized membrane protein
MFQQTFKFIYFRKFMFFIPQIHAEQILWTHWTKQAHVPNKLYELTEHIFFLFVFFLFSFLLWVFISFSIYFFLFCFFLFLFVLVFILHLCPFIFLNMFHLSEFCSTIWSWWIFLSEQIGSRFMIYFPLHICCVI